MTNDIAKIQDFLEVFEEKAKESLYLQKRNASRQKTVRRQARIVKLERNFKNSYLGGVK
jgi:hypothetical protein